MVLAEVVLHRHGDHFLAVFPDHLLQRLKDGVGIDVLSAVLRLAIRVYQVVHDLYPFNHRGVQTLLGKELLQGRYGSPSQLRQGFRAYGVDVQRQLRVGGHHLHHHLEHQVHTLFFRVLVGFQGRQDILLAGRIPPQHLEQKGHKVLRATLFLSLGLGLHGGLLLLYGLYHLYGNVCYIHLFHLLSVFGPKALLYVNPVKPEFTSVVPMPIFR